jgi:hypothetical protein
MVTSSVAQTLILDGKCVVTLRQPASEDCTITALHLQARQALWLGHLFTSWERATRTLTHARRIETQMMSSLGEDPTITNKQYMGAPYPRLCCLAHPLGHNLRCGFQTTQETQEALYMTQRTYLIRRDQPTSKGNWKKPHFKVNQFLELRWAK